VSWGKKGKTNEKKRDILEKVTNGSRPLIPWSEEEEGGKA